MQVILFFVWYMVAVLPVLIFQEGNKKLVNFLKKRGIYWDIWHSLLLVFIILLVVFILADL